MVMDLQQVKVAGGTQIEVTNCPLVPAENVPREGDIPKLIAPCQADFNSYTGKRRSFLLISQ